MATIYWAPLLHFYQPPLQLPHVLRKVVDESYRPLLAVFQEYPHARVTVNINGVLTEMLYDGGYSDVLDQMRALAEAGRLEFTGSGKYHPILPLIPKEHMERQIRLNYLTNRHFFGEAYNPRGFFPPEMCYSDAIVEPVVEARHQWMILSGVACPVEWPRNVVHQTGREEESLAVFFRDDVLSNKISFQTIDGPAFVEHLHQMNHTPTDMYVVTAMDAETFGHHIQNWEQLFLAEVYEALAPSPQAPAEIRQRQRLEQQHRGLLALAEAKEEQQVLLDVQEEIRIVTLSELVDIFPRGRRLVPRASSWSTTTDDTAAGVPYPLWQHKDNYIHKLQWQHVELCLELVQTAHRLTDNDRSRRFADIAESLLDQALHSCQFWWASKRPMWDVNMVSRGLSQQQEATFNAYKAINVSAALESLKRDAYYRLGAARDVAHKIHDQLFWD